MSDILETEETPESGKKGKTRPQSAASLQTELWTVPDAENETEVTDSADTPDEKKETVGDILRKARSEKKLDIRDVAADLCIRPRFLEDLENGNTKELPGDAYAQGFVRSYASYLGLDAVGLAARYKLETSDNLNETLKVVSVDPEEAEKSAPAPKFVFISLGVLLIGYILWMGSRSGTGDEVSVVVDPITVSEESYPLPEEVSAPPSPTSGETATAENGDKALTEPVPPVPPKKPEPSAIRYSPKTYGRQTAGTRLYLEALEEVWIEIKRGDTLMISRNLYKGDRYFVPVGAENTVLKTGNAGGLVFYLDGKRMPPIGPRGALRSNISLDPDKFPAVEKKEEVAEEPSESGEAGEVSENEEPAEEKAEEE